MTSMPQDKNEKNSIKIDGPLTIYEVSKLKDELLSCFDTLDEIVLDLSKVTECDIAGVQVLFAVRKTADKKNRSIRFEKASVSVVSAFKSSGMNLGDILNP